MRRLSVVIAIVGGGCTKREDKLPPPPIPPAPEPVVVDAAPPVAPATWMIEPPNGLVVARDRFRPRITVGTSGVIVAHAAPTERLPPPYAAQSECDWSESVTVLRWKDLEAPPPELPSTPASACSKTRPSFRPHLRDLQFEPLAVVCRHEGGYRCIHVTLNNEPPPIALPASLGVPRLATFYANYLGPELRLGVLGVQLTGTKLTATATRIDDAPVSSVLVDRVDPPCDDPADCHLSILPASEEGTVEVTLAHRSGKKLVVRMDERARRKGAPTTTTESRDPRPSRPLAVGEGGALVRRYDVGRIVDAPIEGPIGRPVLSFDDAQDPTSPQPAAMAVAWIEGTPPDARLRVGRIPVSISMTWKMTSAVDVARGDLGTVALASLSGRLALAWSAREEGRWVVRVAELRKPQGPVYSGEPGDR